MQDELLSRFFKNKKKNNTGRKTKECRYKLQDGKEKKHILYYTEFPVKKQFMIRTDMPDILAFTTHSVSVYYRYVCFFL